MPTLYKKDDIVLLADNRYHLGLVRENQLSSTSEVLVQWMKYLPIFMKPGEIILESAHVRYHPAQRIHYDIWELLDSEKPTYNEISLWEQNMKQELEQCRITRHYPASFKPSTRQTVRRRVHNITEAENGQLLGGTIQCDQRKIQVWRHRNDSVWTSLREEATGIAMQRIKP